MSRALAGHDAVARTAVDDHRGKIVKMTGDGIFAVFADPVDALDAALNLQLALADTTATNGVQMNVRCGLHCGAVERRDRDVFGTEVNRAARIMSAAHGGQVLLSQKLFESVIDRMPARGKFLDLGAVRLRDLANPERVYQLLHPQLRRDFPALRGLESTPNNLLRQASSFVGRERELAEVKSRLGATALLTLVGVGGLGKTRLALQVAAAVMDDYPDGVWFVDLAPVGDATLVPQVLADVFGVKEEVGRPVVEAVVKYVRNLKLLLILDNCEHMVDACADLARHLLRAGPAVKLLATSREPLRIAGETAYPVPALAVPDAGHATALEALRQYESVQLFIDRAVAVNPSFVLTQNNAAAVIDICRRLDGIPLALELAAARVRAFSAETIAERLSDRFQLLTGGDRTAMPRQQTLRAAIDWSYDLLTEDERAVLRRLSVFAGGWTLDAAEVVGSGAGIVAADVLDLLSNLVDKSLVTAREGSGGTRYHLLETVRQYGNDKLREANESDLHRDAHLDHFRTIAETADSLLRGAGQAQGLGRLHAENDNLRAALEWACSAGRTASGLALARALGFFWHIRSDWSEGRYWLQRVEESPDAVDYPDDLAWTLYYGGMMAMFLSDSERSERCLTRSLALARACGNRRCEAYALEWQGACAMMAGNFELADARHAECKIIFREIGDRWGTAFYLWHAGEIRHGRGDSDGALALWEQSLSIFQELGDEHRAVTVLLEVGMLRVRNGEFQRGADMMRRALRIGNQLGAKFTIANALWSFGEATMCDGNQTSALELFLAAVALYDAIGTLRSGAPAVLEIAAARVWFSQNQAIYERAAAEKRVLSMDEAIDLALGYEFVSDAVSR